MTRRRGSTLSCASIGVLAAVVSSACGHGGAPDSTTRPIAAAPPTATHDDDTAAPQQVEGPTTAVAEPPAAAEPPAPDPDEVPLDTTLDLAALARLGVELPAISRDGRYFAMAAKTRLSEPSDAESIEVWVFAFPQSAREFEAVPDVLPVVTRDDAKRLATKPTVGVRDRVVAQTRTTTERLVGLAFDAADAIVEDSDLIEGRDGLRKRWKVKPFTITQSGTDPASLVVKKGKRIVATISGPYGDEHAGQCMEFVSHDLFPTPSDDAWLVVTRIDGPPALGCDPKPRLRRIAKPRDD